MALRRQRRLDLIGELDVVDALRQPHRLEIVHAGAQRRALDHVGGEAEVLLPVGDQRAAAEMRAGRVARDVDAARIAAEARRVLRRPRRWRGAPASIIGIRSPPASIDVDEVEHDEMRARMDEASRPGTHKSLARPPRQAPPWMNTTTGALALRVRIDVEHLDRRRPVGDALRRAEPGAHDLAVGGVAVQHLRDIGRVFRSGRRRRRALSGPCRATRAGPSQAVGRRPPPRRRSAPPRPRSRCAGRAGPPATVPASSCLPVLFLLLRHCPRKRAIQ